jgi:hypothetical protein
MSVRPLSEWTSLAAGQVVLTMQQPRLMPALVARRYGPGDCVCHRDVLSRGT